MKKTLTTTTGIIMLAVPFMLSAADLSLDDAYHDEDLSAFSTPSAGSQNVRHSDVSSSEMYAYETRDAYEFGTISTSSSERTEIAVFSEGASPSQDIDLPYLRWDD